MDSARMMGNDMVICLGQIGFWFGNLKSGFL